MHGLDNFPAKNGRVQVSRSLVLDWRNYDSPVNGGWDVIGDFCKGLTIVGVKIRHLSTASQHSLILCLSPRRELVVAHGVSVALLGVEVSDSLILLGKDGETELFLFIGSNSQAIVFNVLVEFGDELV